MYIYILVKIFFFIMVYHRLLNRFLCVIQRTLLSIHSTQDSLSSFFKNSVVNDILSGQYIPILFYSFFNDVTLLLHRLNYNLYNHSPVGYLFFKNLTDVIKKVAMNIFIFLCLQLLISLQSLLLDLAHKLRLCRFF